MPDAGRSLPMGNNTKGTHMNSILKTVAVAGALALSSTLAFAQSGSGSSQTGGAMGKTTTDSGTHGGAMKNDGMGTTGSSMPSGKDSSTQGANTAGSAERKGDATSPGGMMKK